ncbi:MAG: ATP-binding cassette domain-containing protein [Massilia sp.]
MMPLSVAAHPEPAGPDRGGHLLAGLAASFAVHAARADADAALASLGRMFDLRGRFPLYDGLRHAVARGDTVRAFGPVYFLGDGDCPEALQRDIADAVHFCESLLGIERPTIIVELSGELRGAHLTITSFPGLATIRLATSSTGYPDRLRHAACHEVAHAFLSCGNRLLDEGWAHHVAHRFGADRDDGGDAPCPFSLRSLLSKAAGRTMLFEDAGADVSHVHAISALGARVIASVVDRNGVAGVLEVFDRVSRSTSDAESCAIVEAALGVALDAFHRVQVSEAELAALADDALEAGFRAYADETPEAFDPVVDRLLDAAPSRHAAILDSLLSALIAKSVLILNLGGTVGDEELATIDMYFKDAGILPESRLWALRGHRAVLSLKLEKANFIKAATYNKKAMAAYERALALNGNDPDAVIGRALLFINTPGQYGGNAATGYDMLRGLAGDGRYARHAGVVLGRTGGAAPAAPAALPAAVPGQRETAIRVRNLRHRCSASFSLNVPELHIVERQRVAIIGRNGCGKTTLLETIAGLRPHAEGDIVVLGETVDAEHNRDLNKKLGMALQQVGLFSSMYVREIVRVHRTVYQTVDPGIFDTLGMKELLGVQYKALSRGQVQRVQLYLALAHAPALVLLDEPSLGLDEWFANALRTHLGTMDATMLMISHAAADIALADRVLIVENGEVVDDGVLDALIEQYTGRIKLKVHQALPVDVQGELARVPGMIAVSGAAHGEWKAFATQDAADAFRAIIDRNRVKSFSIEAATIEDFLAEVTRQPAE